MAFLQVGVSPYKGLEAIVLASMGALAFPPFSLWYLSLLSIVGFLFLLRDTSTRESLNLGLLFGAFYGLGTMYWFFNIFATLAVPLIALMAGYFGLLGALIGSTRGKNAIWRAFLVAMFAVGVEWVRGDAWYLRFPWYTAPHALASSPPWIAGVRWLGVYGLSFAIWLIAGLGVYSRVYYLALFLLLPLGSFLLSPFQAPDKVALLFQGEEQTRIENLVKKANGSGFDLIVLPEYAYTTSVESVLKSKEGPASLAKRFDCPVVFGAIVGDYGDSGFDNVAAVVNSEGTLLGTFTKQRPVPLMSDGKPGRDRPVFPVKSDEILGIAICYDFDAPDIAASLVRQGATVLIAPTFDAISWGEVQHANHELLARLRAVENDRWFLRATSSGRTETVNPHGYPSQNGIDMGKADAQVFSFSHRRTFALGGQMFFLGPLAAIGTSAFVVWQFLIRKNRPVLNCTNPTR
jgi:apolipoprotein N-acyltransferase